VASITLKGRCQAAHRFALGLRRVGLTYKTWIPDQVGNDIEGVGMTLRGRNDIEGGVTLKWWGWQCGAKWQGGAGWQ